MRVLSMLAGLVLLCSSAFCQTEGKQYNTPVNVPDSLYFANIVDMTGGSLSVTNNENYMWYPVKVEFNFAGTPTTTNAISRIIQRKTTSTSASAVTTNDIGIVETNSFHAVTNVAYVYLTNLVYSADSTGTAYVSWSPTSKEYMQRGDVLKIASSDTNAAVLRIIGQR
jgi:hypothetical protein